MALTSRVAETTSSGCKSPRSPAVPQQVVPIGTSTSSARQLAICLIAPVNPRSVIEHVGWTATRRNLREIGKLGRRSRNHAIESMILRLSYCFLGRLRVRSQYLL